MNKDTQSLDLIPMEEVLNAPFVINHIQLLSYGFVKEKSVLPIDERDGVLVVAMSCSYDLEALKEIRGITGKTIKEVYCSQTTLQKGIEKCYSQRLLKTSQYIERLKKTSSSQLSPINEKANDLDLLNYQDQSPVVRLLDMIIIEAIEQGASDIHFEPMNDKLLVRYRIDGVLQFRHTPPHDLSNQLLARIKVLAKMDVSEHRLPQDGRIKLKIGAKDVDFRVSSVPVIFGERIVLRILDKSNVVRGLGMLGLESKALRIFQKYLYQNQGIILVTGPTGSGKTTTLYSALHLLSSEETNVMTIEDPVEYNIQGIAQIGVNPKIGLYFSTGLRHILRQDPDVIMIGEIRDQETAEIAVQASLTGHLVMSTLHTNDAASSLTRLVDMGIPPYLLASSVTLVVAQRLVRRVCEKCKEEYTPSKEEQALLKGYRGPLFRGKGCEACCDSGYKGRVGIYEVMPMNALIKKHLLNNADSFSIQEIALKLGMSSLYTEGVSCVKKGITTTQEILKLIRQLETCEQL